MGGVPPWKVRCKHSDNFAGALSRFDEMAAFVAVNGSWIGGVTFAGKPRSYGDYVSDTIPL
jgi:hypothetical protein